MDTKCVVITGGGSGIGAGLGKAFALDGAHVVFVDLNAEAAAAVAESAQNESGCTCISIKANVADKADVQAAVSRAEKEFGQIDILINCAGISRIIPFLECDEQTWDVTLDVNLKGMFFFTQAVVPGMIKNKSGNILNLSSQSGKVGTSGYQAYCASKAGVIGLTQSLAVELAPYGVRVNSICPGVVLTPMWDKQIKDYGKKRNLKTEEVMPYFAKKIPLGRIGTIEDIANLAIFLASDKASYITGQAINVSGGSVMF
jgi:NAD(P)-dependent dehydrogenase (short-subunit alcohol dehydrogenase family)